MVCLANFIFLLVILIVKLWIFKSFDVLRRSMRLFSYCESKTSQVIHLLFSNFKVKGNSIMYCLTLFTI